MEDPNSTQYNGQRVFDMTYLELIRARCLTANTNIQHRIDDIIIDTQAKVDHHRVIITDTQRLGFYPRVTGDSALTSQSVT